jgi:diacylglycerol kinase (ATP)
LFSNAPGELTGLARQAADNGAGLLVIVGGDGSVNEVVNGIAGREGVELAVIARGTGWDFARSLGLPRSLDAAIAVALGDNTRMIDLGRVSYRSWAGAEAQAYFANVASAGMSGAIAQRANDTTKAFGGKASYVWATFAVFARWSNTEVEVTVDGLERRARMHDVIVANGTTLGLPHPKAEVLRGSTVTVDAPEPLPIQLDGEQPGTTPARFELVPRALRVRV